MLYTSLLLTKSAHRRCWYNANGPKRHASSCDPSHRPNQGQRPRHPSQDPSQRPNQVPSQIASQDPIQGHSAVVPSGHASSVVPIARRLNYQSWQ